MRILTICQGFVLLVIVLINSVVLGETAEEWFRKGYYEADTSEKAIEYFTNAISVNPNLKSAYLYRGRAKMGKGDLDGAIEDFSKAIEISSRFVPAYKARGKAKKAKGDLEGAKQDFLRAEQEQKKGDYQLEDMDAGILADPDNAQLYWNRARYKSQKEDYAGAIRDYDKYVELVGKTNNSSVYESRAFAKKARGDIAGAMADYTLIIEQFPSESAYRQRARFKMEIGDIEGAKADELKAKKAHQEKIIREIQQLDQELKELETIPLRRRVYFKESILESIASKRMKIEDYAGAIADLNKAIEIKPSAYQFKLRAKAKKAMGDMEGYQADLTESRWVDKREKLQLLNQALDNNPQDLKALVERAQIWMYVREYPKALADTNKAIEIEPSLIEALKIRSRAKKKLGDRKGSRADRRLILQIEQNRQK